MCLQSAAYLKSLLKNFPSKARFVFAYGSAVFKQNNGFKNNVIDLLFAVENPIEWHRSNIIQNSSHYSFLKYFGPDFIAKFQSNFAAKCYYNTLIPLNDGTNNMIKYGVIKEEDLIEDLLDWNSLYISGRLHKPVKFLVEPQSDTLKKALQINLQSAVHLSLLLLNETFTEEQLYLTIAATSYKGDFRMTFGEDKNKVQNIVKPHIDKFRRIYQPYLESEAMKHLLTFNSSTQLYVQNLSSGVLFHHLSMLPKTVQYMIYVKYNKSRRILDLDEYLMIISKSYRCPYYVQSAVNSIVRYSSYTQTVKGFFTAGVLKSIKYASAKIFKMTKSLIPEHLK
ncbi:phosphatidate cytidylyltransferase-like protein [Leptotrombidium deliense]|uniref:Phosphatidate cytidylyltransferase, mitochondrial n=1 Tax=Leptotrombidium deliense TaxID=299467 RepID=A0A443S3S4_9ACAR|nr:phosphatidate cytidylyltransferase-like protein [Leptotrombidium deliense]